MKEKFIFMLCKLLFMIKFLWLFFVIVLFIFVFFLYGCKKKDLLILKVFVRFNSNELIFDVQVIIIGDIYLDFVIVYYIDILLINFFGFVQFDMVVFFDVQDKKIIIGYFNILVKKNLVQVNGYVKCCVYIIVVKMVIIDF